MANGEIRWGEIVMDVKHEGGELESRKSK